MLQARLRRVVDSLSDLRIWLVAGDVVPWNRLIGPKVSSDAEVFGHLVALPTEDPIPKTIEDFTDEDDAKGEMAARMHTYFHRIRIQHPFTKDVTTLCGWWRLDAVNSPNYEDFRKASLGKEADQKATEISMSDDFLARTRTFDMSASTRDFSSLEERGGAYGRAMQMLKEEGQQATVYASAQKRMIKEYNITSLFTKQTVALRLQRQIMFEVEKVNTLQEQQRLEQVMAMPLDDVDSLSNGESTSPSPHGDESSSPQPPALV